MPMPMPMPDSTGEADGTVDNALAELIVRKAHKRILRRCFNDRRVDVAQDTDPRGRERNHTGMQPRE